MPYKAIPITKFLLSRKQLQINKSGHYSLTLHINERKDIFGKFLFLFGLYDGTLVLKIENSMENEKVARENMIFKEPLASLASLFLEKAVGEEPLNNYSCF